MSDTHLTEDLVNEYIDGVVSIETQLEIKNHLVTCEACAAQVNTLRALFVELNELPDLKLERDFSKAVLGKIKPSVALPARWQWALWGQLGFAILIIFLTIPTLLRSTLFSALRPASSQFLDLLLRSGEMIMQPIQAINTLLLQILNGAQMIQVPELPFSLVLITPVVLATGVLWLVGNGLLLKNRS